MEETIKLILSEIIENPEIIKNLNNNTNIVTDTGIDSLKMISFILRVEEETNVYIDFDSFSYDDLTSVERFARFLEKCENADTIIK